MVEEEETPEKHKKKCKEDVQDLWDEIENKQDDDEVNDESQSEEE